MGKVIQDINDSGFGLTFGMHTRIDGRVQQVTSEINAGNIYINRNQIGAAVGSQPFGGEGLSGTGPKAGGPRYVPRFTLGEPRAVSGNMPGPTGESNRLSLHPRGTVLCLGPGIEAQKAQVKEARARGCEAVIGEGVEAIASAQSLGAVAYWGPDARPVALAMAEREGAIMPLILKPGEASKYSFERHICIDTTASGGNTSLLAEAAGQGRKAVGVD